MTSETRITLTLTDDEAQLLLHMLGVSVMQLLRAGPNDPRVMQLSEVIVRLQTAREHADPDAPAWRRFYGRTERRHGDSE